MVIVLYEPQIPQNTGNIVRTCAVTGTQLILIEPLGFSINDRWLKRAGLDYWEGVDVQVTDSLEALIEKEERPFTFFSSKGNTRYTDISYRKDHLLIFGSETSGLPTSFHEKWGDKMAAIPQIEGKRCLNLATSAGITLFEALRQQDFPYC